MEKLSVVIITYNEERNIERCLKSVQSIADEIVVLDSISTDRTKEICEAYNVKFFEHAFDGHIEQKNRALTYTSNPLVLSLDADEAPDETLLKSIQEVLENRTADAYSFNRKTNYCGKWILHCGWYPDKKLRLWDKSKGKWGGKNPHDTFILEPGVKSEHLKGDLLHYSFYTISQHAQTINKFTDYSSVAAFEKGERSNLLKIFLKPKWKFFRDFIIKQGFRDGYYGWVICKASAHAKFLKYVKLRELQKNA